MDAKPPLLVGALAAMTASLCCVLNIAALTKATTEAGYPSSALADQK